MTTLIQGDTALLDTDLARGLLASTELARMAYVVGDGTPRVLPMLFHWTGEEVVMATFGGAHKINALRARPDVAITIDTSATPPQSISLRGRAELTDVEGLVPEYVFAHRRYGGAEQAAAVVAELDRPGMRMVRIAVRPAWVATLDFRTRFPAAAPMGG